MKVICDIPEEVNDIIKDSQLNIQINPNDGQPWPKEMQFQTGEVSDGYHTFDELYEFRKMYNAALFNEWASQGKYNVHKSFKHEDGEDCFGVPNKWFIVVAQLPTGQISNHYKVADWELFKIPVTTKALFPYDGHTPADVLKRLKNL